MSAATPLTRNDYAAGGTLAADDFARDQAYHLAVQAIRCRGLHTPGVATGLQVSQVAGRPQAVRVASGMAVDPEGGQIILPQDVLLDLSGEVDAVLYLTIAAESRLVDWTITPAGAGYVRAENEARLALSGTPPMPDGAAVLLARLLFTPERRLLPPDLSVRRLCGLAVGHVELPPPIAAGAPPRLAVTDDGGALVLTSPLADLFGGLHVHGTVAVGPSPVGSAGLSVQTPPPVPGAGLISSNGPYILGADAYDLAALAPGDQILVPAPGEVMASATLACTVVAVAGQTVTVDSAPVPPLQNSPYAVVRSDLLRIRHQPMAIALAISTQGAVAVGGAAVSSAALGIRNGDLLLASDSVVRFIDDGAVSAGAGARAISLAASQQLLQVRDTGTLEFDVAGAPIPGLLLDPEGRVGVGTAPTSRLTVDGIVRATGGVVFPDGSQQTAGVAAIPIGTVIAWWRAAGDPSFVGAGFQLCDGSTITDPASPLVGLKTPDLNGAFVRGAINYEQIGQTGGAATHTHDFNLAQHTHPIAHTHPVSGTTTNVLGTAGDNIAGSSVSTDSHMHIIQAVSGLASPASSGSNDSTPAAKTEPASSIPPYISLLRAMRIR